MTGEDNRCYIDLSLPQDIMNCGYYRDGSRESSDSWEENVERDRSRVTLSIANRSGLVDEAFHESLSFSL